MDFFIITMLGDERRLDNVNHLVEQLSKNRYNAKIFPAICPAQNYVDDPSYDSAYRVRRFGYHLTRGEVGCFQSHKAIWKELSQRETEIFGVLEDDAIFLSDISGAVSAALSCQEYWDVCRLQQVFPSKIGITKGRRGLFVLRFPFLPQLGTGAYLLNGRAARYLYDSSVSIRQPVDHFLDDPRNHGLRVLDLTPGSVGILEDLPSVIGDRGWNAKVNGRRGFYRIIQRDVYNLGWHIARGKMLLRLLFT
ncbi:glycosyltransferase family 25 protein (plasmid) [Acidithiobacillus sp. AC3]